MNIHKVYLKLSVVTTQNTNPSAPQLCILGPVKSRDTML